ncbi:MAG TPA: CHAD domain-containing protein [Gammaproteobacteria bacterium]
MGKVIWPDEPVRHGQTVSVAFATVLAHNFARLQAWEPAAREGADPEGVHQVRVSLRRLRSACSTFGVAVPKRATRAWRQRMRELAGALGTARDLDVLRDEVLAPLAEHLPLPGAAAFGAAVARARADAQGAVLAMLDGSDYADFKAGFPGWVAAREWERAVRARPRRQRLRLPVEGFAAELLQRQLGQVAACGDAVDPADPAAMHRLRIECKKLRYLAEFFRGLFTDMEPFIAALKQLQDLLGVMHDCAVSPALVERVVGTADDGELRRYAAGVVGWRSREYQALAAGFAERWQAFRAAPLPWGG